ncbi:MAG TPA: TolC family protein [Terriglobales bacterium]|nr:TolC family protein [Terriglobales bacterium]
MKFLRVLAFLLLAPAALPATDPWALDLAQLGESMPQHRAEVPPKTLVELEEIAMVGNPEIRAAVRRVTVAEQRQGGAGALEDPAFQYRDWGTPLQQPWNLNQAQNMFMITQALPGPGKRGLRSEIAGKDIDIAKAELEATRRDVRTRVRKAFYDLLRNFDEWRLHDEQATLAREGLQAARIKYTVGKVPQQDVLKAQIALTRLLEHLIDLEQNGQVARATLNALLGRDPTQPLEVAGEYGIPDQLPSVVDLEKLALENRPELLALSKTIEQSEAKQRLAEKSYSPDYAIGAGYMLQPEDAKFRNNYMLEFSLNLPWLNRRKHESEIGEARAAVSARQAEYENQRNAVFLQIQEAWIKARTAQRMAALYRDTLRPQAEASLKAAAAAYKNDRADFLNLLDSQNLNLDVQSSYFKAEAEFENRLAELEQAVGAPIPREAGRTSPAGGAQ